jgi:hypothetical protein
MIGLRQLRTGGFLAGHMSRRYHRGMFGFIGVRGMVVQRLVQANRIVNGIALEIIRVPPTTRGNHLLPAHGTLRFIDHQLLCEGSLFRSHQESASPEPPQGTKSRWNSGPAGAWAESSQPLKLEKRQRYPSFFRRTAS